MSNKIKVFRNEEHYLISMYERSNLINRLSQLLIPDKYGDKLGGYKVRSLYFDSPDNRDYHDKMGKEEFRTRIRIRTYDIDGDIAKLEIKRQYQKNQVKDSIIVTKRQVLEIIKGNYEVILEEQSEIANLIYNMMSSYRYRPVAIVQYDRVAFTHPLFNTRITIDSNLEYSDMTDQLFAHDLVLHRFLSIHNAILEVKYEKYLFPYLQAIIGSLDKVGESPSKYETCRSLLQDYYN